MEADRKVYSKSEAGQEFILRYEGDGEREYRTFSRPSKNALKSIGKTFEEVVRRILYPIESARSSFAVMQMVPWHPEFPDVPVTGPAQNYVQCAGSVEGVVVEFCCPVGAVPGEPGSWFNEQAPVGNVVYGLGRPEAADRSVVEVRWNSGRVVEVPGNEVFSLGEAAEIFATYFDTGFPPLDLERRDLGLL